MARPLAALISSRSRWFDLGVFARRGCCVVVWSTVRLFAGRRPDGRAGPVCVPLIVIIAKFPMVLDSGEGGIEVGFDSSILMFLLCTLDSPYEALLIWSLGVLVTQITTDKRPAVKLFNIGVGILGGGGRRGGRRPGPRPDGEGTLPRAARRGPGGGAATSPPTSCSPRSRSPSRPTPRSAGHLVQRGTLFAIACFVPFDSLGYLGAVVAREPGVVHPPAARRPAGDPARRHPRGQPRQRERPPAQRALRRGRPGPDALRHPPGRRRAHRRRPPAAADQAGGGPVHAARRPRGRRPAARRPAGPLDRGARPAPGPVDDHRRPAGPRGDGRGLLRRLRPAPADRGHDPPRPPRPAHQPAQPRPAARPGRARAADVAAARQPDRAALRRPRRLQAGQRPLRPRRRRRGAHRRGPAAHRAACGRATPWPGSAATSSRCCSRTCTRPRSAPPATGSSPRSPAARTSPATSSRSPPASAWRSATAARPPRACCATPTWRCTRPSRAARTSGSSTNARSAARASSASSSWSRCAPPWRPATSPSSTSPSSAPPPATSPASRRWRAGSPTASTYPRTCSSGSRRRPAWWSRSATSCSSRPPATPR